jgi:hypothetical protein
MIFHSSAYLFIGIQEILEMKCEAMREVPYSNPPIYQTGQIAVTNYKISFLQAESMDSTLVNAVSTISVKIICGWTVAK